MYETLEEWFGDFDNPGIEPSNLAGPVDVKEWYEGRFQINELLGAGHSCVAFKALDTQLDREVALKIWHGWSSYNSSTLLREGRILAKLNHPQIVQVFDFGLGPGSRFSRPWLALEFLGRITLRDALNLNGRIPIRDRLRICIAIGIRLAGIIQYLHDSAGLCQLDLKPDNVATDSEFITLKLMDLGSSLGPDVTWRGRLGTPGYIAPEILEAGLQATRESDLFSLGMLLYEVLTGHNELVGIQETLRVAPKWGRRLGRSVSMQMVSSEISSPESLRVLGVMKDLPLADLLEQVDAPQEVNFLISQLCSYQPKERPSPEQVRAVLGAQIKDDRSVSPKIFLSHSWHDKDRFVRRFAEELQRRGFSIWLDDLSLLTGEPFWHRIAKAIDDADFVVLILSETSIVSRGVQEELQMAHLGSLDAVKLLPLRIDPIRFEALPAYLRARHVIDFVGWEDDRKFDERIARLTSDIRALAEAAHNPGAPADGWRRR